MRKDEVHSLGIVKLDDEIISKFIKQDPINKFLLQDIDIFEYAIVDETDVYFYTEKYLLETTLDSFMADLKEMLAFVKSNKLESLLRRYQNAQQTEHHQGHTSSEVQ